MKFRFVAKEKLKKIPKAPGVYALNADRETLYIGKAANLRDRVKNHFAQPSYRDNLFIDQVTRAGWIETQSDIDALLLESHLIKKYQPKYNVMWKDDKGYFYVGITPSTIRQAHGGELSRTTSLRAGKEKLPRVFLTHQPRIHETWNMKHETKHKQYRVSRFRIHASRYIGPFVDGKAIKQVLRLLRRIFPYYTLRRGSGQAAKKHPVLPCPYCHIGLCPGPRLNPKEYRRNIKNLFAVLQGKKTSVLKNLKRERSNASRKQRFEEAGKLRDQVFALERIMAHRLFSSEIHEISMLSHEDSEVEKKLQTLLKTKKRIRRIEAYDISNTQGQQATGSMVTFLQGKPAKEWYRKFKIHITGKSNDFAMMEELISRRLTHTEWPYPDLMLIDGGKGQLSSALAALKKSKVKSPKLKVCVAALAKKHNELFLPGRKSSVFLRNLPREFSNLLLYIRDEAHRFAITYHRKLRKIDVIGTS